MRFSLFFSFLLCSTVCHAMPSENRVMPCGTLMLYSVGDELKINKNNIVQACHSLHCTDDQMRLALAVAMGESQTCCASQRDASKDCTPSANYSCFNLNKDMLEQVGWHEGGTDLNSNDNVFYALAYILAATSQYGVDGFLHFHRGGRTALQDGKSYGAEQYAARIKCIMEVLKSEPKFMTDDTRLAFDTPHV